MPEEPGLRSCLQLIARFRPLTSAQEIALLHDIRGGARESLERLINGNLGRVARIAAEFVGAGLGQLDLIAEGTLGLFIAARRCDEERYPVFTRYAEERIRRQIREALCELA